MVNSEIQQPCSQVKESANSSLLQARCLSTGVDFNPAPLAALLQSSRIGFPFHGKTVLAQSRESRLEFSGLPSQRILVQDNLRGPEVTAKVGSRAAIRKSRPQTEFYNQRSPGQQDFLNLKRPETDTVTPETQPCKLSGLSIVRILVAVVVVIALGYMIFKAAGQLKETGFRLDEVSPGWWLVAVVSYVLSMSLSGSFWHRVLLSLGQKPAFGNSMLAFFASQLAKYVPGKAMVVVARTDMIRGPHVKPGPATASVFVETLSWIFVGSAISAVLIAFQFREQRVLGLTAIVMAVLAGVLTWPSVFRAVATRVSGFMKALANPTSQSEQDSKETQDRFAGLDLPTMAYGWFVMTIGWCLNGLSLWLVLRGMQQTGVVPGDFPLTLLCVALATVAGFVSMLPGGLGVRELVIVPLLGTRFGIGTAVIAAVVIRLVWLASEIIVSAILYLSTRLSTRTFKPAS